MPGSIVTTSSAPPVNGPSTDTDTAFIALNTEKGPLDPTLLSGESDLEQFGDDTADTSFRTWLTAFFRLGGRSVWFRRIVGPDPGFASITLNGSGATASVAFTANSVGEWANALLLAVISGTGSNKVLVLSNAAGEIARSGDLATKQAVLDYAGFSTYGAFTSAGAGTMLVNVAAANLTGGTDDFDNVTIDEKQAAADITRKKGPGQLLIPGDDDPDVAEMLAALGVAANRRVISDVAIGEGTAGTIVAAGLVLRDDTNAGAIIPAVPRLVIGPAVTGGTDRFVPASVGLAALLARQDFLTGNPNRAAAGDRGIYAPYVTGVEFEFTDAELEDLDDAGINVHLDLYDNGQIRNYGFNTAADPVEESLYAQMQNVRLDMLITARGGRIADTYYAEGIDSKGRTAGRYAVALEHMLAALPEGALYEMLDINGDLVDPGYIVDASTGVGSGFVNTPETAAAQQLRAVLGVRRSPGAKFVFLEIVNTPVGQEF